MDTLYTFWDNITHYKTKSVHFLGLMNSATKEAKSDHNEKTLLEYGLGLGLNSKRLLILSVGSSSTQAYGTIRE